MDQVKALELLERGLQQRVGKRDVLLAQRKQVRSRIEELNQEREDIGEALSIVQAVGQATQREIEVHISELASLALAAVFPEPYRLELSFELERSRSVAHLQLVDKEGNKVEPMEAVGGGVVDIAALALRVSLHTLQRPKPRPVLWLDEPCRFVSRNLQKRAFLMLREISERLGLQFIIVTHEEELIEVADKVFLVEKKKGNSHIVEEK